MNTGEHEIYKVLLELKESSGRTEASLEDIKDTLVEQSIKHDKLQLEHNVLKESHNSYKGKILLVSGTLGSIFGAIVAYIKVKWAEWFS